MKHFKHILSQLFSSNIAIIVIPLLMIIPNVCLCFTEDMTPLAIAANIILPSGFYILIISAFKRTYIGAILLIPIMVLCAFQIVLLFLYHGSIIAIDMFMNVATTNSTEASELLKSLTTAMGTVLTLYLPVIIWCIYRLFKPQRADNTYIKTGRITGIATISIGIIILTGAYLTDSGYRISRQLFPVNVCHNMIEAMERMHRITQYHETSHDFSYGAVSTHPESQKEIYVMVIGETSRADNFGIFGYERNTTPNLEKIKNLVAYPNTLSESNTTHKSVPMLMSSLTAENFDSIYFRKSTITAFNEAGYHTAYFSAQKRNHSFIDFFGEEAHDVDFISDHDTTGCVNDTSLVERTRIFLDDNRDARKLFIVLHTYGSHFRYDDRYTADNAYFSPDNCAMADKDHRDGLMNAYDNTIRNVDRTLSGIIQLLDSRDDACTAMIYAADHGEDIFDDNRERFLHASPTPTYWQLHVPLLIWMSDMYKSAYPDKVHMAALHVAKDVSSTRSLSPTILDMAGMESPFIQNEMALTSDQYTEPNRIYLTDYNEAVPLTESGLKSQDFAMIQNLIDHNKIISDNYAQHKVFHFK